MEEAVSDQIKVGDVFFRPPSRQRGTIVEVTATEFNVLLAVSEAFIAFMTIVFDDSSVKKTFVVQITSESVISLILDKDRREWSYARWNSRLWRKL